MSKFPTSTDFYYRIKHDPNINPTGIKITYLDSLKKKYVDMDFSKWVFVEDGGDIPVHRVYFFKYKDEIIWDRENKILNLEPVYKDIKSKLPDSFTLLTWNILNPKHSSKKIGLAEQKKDQERQDKIIEQISTFLESVDIVCLQEVNKKMIENFKKHFDSTYNIVSTDLTSGDNIVFLTKYSISSIENIQFSMEKESLKISMDTMIGFSINIYGVHLTSDSQTNSPHKRLEQLEKLSKSIDPNSTNIICGDFNEDNSTHLLLTEIMTDIFNMIDFDSQIQKEDHKQIYTFDPNTNKLAWENSRTKQPHRYDKIFINGFAKPIKPIQILSNISYSDHYPIISSLQIEPNNLAFKPETKNTTSGLFIIIPTCSTDYVELQKFRKELDENYSKWMPHLSIHLGWIPESEFDDWIRSNQDTFKKINSFEVILDKPDYLTHDSAYTLILRPNKSCSDKLVNLFGLFGSGSEPHLTLGKFKEKSKLDSKLKLVTDAKLSIKFNLTQLHLVSRKNRDYGVQLGLVKFGLDNVSNNISNNQIENIISNITNQIQCIFPNVQVILGGSQLYYQNLNPNQICQTNSDLDLLILGSYDQNDFYSKINKFFQSNGSFVHSKFVSNKFMSFIRAIHNDYGELDLHYLETTQTDINKITDPDQKIKSSVYWDNIFIQNYIKTNGFDLIFKKGLTELKTKFKKARIYGQEFCYIGGISLAVMLCWYLKINKPSEWDFKEFCQFYSEYNFSHPICLDGLTSSGTNPDPHVFATIIGPVSKYNTSRNLTLSTFNTIKWYIDNKFESQINFDYKLKFHFKANNYYVFDDVKSFIRSVYLRIILNIEKNISNSNFKFYPLSTQTKANKMNLSTVNKYACEYACDHDCEYEYEYEFGFNFNPNSISNIFEELKNKILVLYSDVSFCQIIIN